MFRSCSAWRVTSARCEEELSRATARKKKKAKDKTKNDLLSCNLVPVSASKRMCPPRKIP